MIVAVVIGVAFAAGPIRHAARRAIDLQPGPDRINDVLIVKLVEGQRRSALPQALFVDAQPLFSRSATVLRADRRAFDPERRLADLSLYFQIQRPDAAALGAALLDHPAVETAYLPFRPAPPPQDLPPETPDLSAEQGYAGRAPDGLGFVAARRWPGGDGANVAIANIEYGWEPAHEDLGNVPPEVAWGWDSGLYDFHGTAVLGILNAEDNGYGITGLAPAAETFVVSPYRREGEYNVAAAIDAAAALLDAGDVLLIEQQQFVLGSFGPVSIEPAVFDAISAAVARGIVVIEPAGNGALDLGDPRLDGWFDRSVRDSGSIMVGGGAPPDAAAARVWTGGSNFGDRVDVQAWFAGITTTTSSGSANLFLPDADTRQGYTGSFGGTSGASAIIAGFAAVANSIAWELWGAPWDPWDLREAMRMSGTPAPPENTGYIGAQPDLERMLWFWGVR